jgi:hypothetical protein
MHMKRTNHLGAKASSAPVNTTLEEDVRDRKIRSLPKFFGSEIWEGDLAEMRKDRKPTPRKAR